MLTYYLDVRLAQTRENLIRAQNDYKLTLTALAKLIGADAEKMNHNE